MNFRKYRSEEHTSELQSRRDLVCRLLLEKKKIPSVPPTSSEITMRIRASDRLSRMPAKILGASVFIFTNTATTDIYTLSLHDALPICQVTSKSNDINSAYFFFMFEWY